MQLFRARLLFAVILILISTFSASASLPPGATITTPTPYSLTGFRASGVGTVYYFEVIGDGSSFSIWGSDIYTDDSSLAKASVHSGSLMAGETGIVKVTLLAGQASYAGTTRNGQTSSNWGVFGNSFMVEPCPSAAFTIDTQPADLDLLAGQSGELTVTASAAGLTYQWYRGLQGDVSNPVTGANSASLTVSAPAATEDYWVAVSDATDTLQSTAATVTLVIPEPNFNILIQPAGIGLETGKTGTLSVAASGSGLSYQWYRGPSGDRSDPITGATNASLSVTAPADSQDYWVEITNPSGTRKSITADVVLVVKGPGLRDTLFARQSISNIGGPVVYDDGRVLQVSGVNLVLHSLNGSILTSVSDASDPFFNSGFMDSEGRVLIFGPNQFSRIDPNTLQPDPGFTTFIKNDVSNTEIFDAIEVPGRGYLLATYTGTHPATTNPYFLLDYSGTLVADWVPEDADDGRPNNARSLDVDQFEDGRILISGRTDFREGISYTRLIAVNPDGSRDHTFDPVIDSWFVEPQADGKVVYISRDSFANYGVGRINADGSPDTVFNGNVPSITNGPIDEIIIEANGKILLVGGFENVDGARYDCFVRLLPDGTIDPDFEGRNGYRISTVALDILSASYDPRGFAYFSPETPTSSFDGLAGMVRIFLDEVDVHIYRQPGAQQIAVGETRTLTVTAAGNGTPAYQWFKDGTAIPGGADGRLVLSNFAVADTGIYTAKATIGGVVDTSSPFLITASGAPEIQSVTVPDSAGTGRSTTFSVDATGAGALSYQWKKNGVNIPGANGADLTLSDLSATDSAVYSVLVTSALGQDLSEEFDFNTVDLLGDLLVAPAATELLTSSLSIAALADGSFILGGYGTRESDLRATLSPYFIRMLANGTVDTGTWAGVSFRTTGLNSRPEDVRVETNADRSAVWLTGRGAVTANPFSNEITRRNADGTHSFSFTVFEEPVNTIQAIAERSDGSFVVADGSKLYLFAADGTDITPPGNFAKNPNAIVVLPDDSYLAGGGSAFSDGTNHVVKFNADGTHDETFTTSGFNNRVEALDLQSDGKIIIGGLFQNLTSGDRSYNYIARLNTDGSVDTTFDDTNRPDTMIHDVHVQENDSIAVGGRFSTFPGAGNDVTGQFLQLLLPNGQVDPLFQPLSGPDNHVYSIDSLPDGRLYIAGSFQNYDGVPVPGVAIVKTSDGTSRPDPFQTYLEVAGVQADERGPDDDPDGDGISNLIEFAYGGDPADPAGAVRLHFSDATSSGAAIKALDPTASVNSAGTYFTTIIRFPKDSQGVTLAIEATLNFPNFSDGSSEMRPYGPPVEEGDFLLQPYHMSVPIGTAPRAFWQIKASME
ncbi:LCCL domain-containing protein [Verrucomicrobiaceae bacterium 227]